MGPLSLVFDGVLIVLMFVGIGLFRTPRTARSGNLFALVAMLSAMALVMVRGSLEAWWVIAVTIGIGGGAGWIVASRVSMLQIPGMVAFQHGAGGVAAFLIATVELVRGAEPTWTIAKASGLLGVVIGAATFSGSMIASGKLLGKLKQPPTELGRHGLLTATLVVAIFGLVVLVGSLPPTWMLPGVVVLIVLSILLGLIIAIRVGAADMPVLISFLNATAGLAAAFCGLVIGNRLLIAFGAAVAASGTVLTLLMCKAMNRSLLDVFVGLASHHAAKPWVPEAARGDLEGAVPSTSDDGEARAVRGLQSAKKVIIVPGYGMAIGQAQFQVATLARTLESRGAEVVFAIHPVAGRMPGHMNVLLAEAEIPYDKLLDMDASNNCLPDADVALVVGACDVVNPAAVETEGTPISGMPILEARRARLVVICNLDEKPGYSGVDNTLYSMPNAVRMFGDAKVTLGRLDEELSC